LFPVYDAEIFFKHNVASISIYILFPTVSYNSMICYRKNIAYVTSSRGNSPIDVNKLMRKKWKGALDHRFRWMARENRWNLNWFFDIIL